MMLRERTTELFRENATSLVKRIMESLYVSLRLVTDFCSDFIDYWTVYPIFRSRFLQGVTASA